MGPLYSVFLSKQAVKSVHEMPEGQKEKLREAFNIMKHNAFSYPYQKIQGESHLFRIRIGDYRILYEIDDHYKIIMVIKVDHRNKVYK